MVRAGYKQTEVGVIPEDWDIKSGLDVFMKIQDGTHFSPKINNGNYLYLTSKNIKDGYLSLEDVCYIDKQQHDLIYKRCNVQYGDILLTKDGANTGNAALNNLQEEFSLLSSVAFLRVNDKSYNRFYLQQILSKAFQKRIQDAMSGNAITRLTLTKIKLLKFYCPPLKEQIAIATALSDIDALINSLTDLIDKKRQIKTATMQQLLTGKQRLAGFGEGKGMKQTELGEMPEDWEVVTLRQLADIKRGASPRPIDSPIWFDNRSAIGWLRISDVTKSNKYLIETTQSLSDKGIANSRLVELNSLVMSICATVGKPVITKKTICIHDGFVVFINLKSTIDFTFYVLQDLESEWGKQGQTGSQMNLNTNLINNRAIRLPPKPEQQAIAQVLSDIDDNINGLETRLAKTKAIKQGMMQELLTGKTRLISPHSVKTN